MSSPAFHRGIFDIRELAGLPPRLTRVKQRLPTSSDPSFRFHRPIRLEPAALSNFSTSAIRSCSNGKTCTKATLCETSHTCGDTTLRRPTWTSISLEAHDDISTWSAWRSSVLSPHFRSTLKHLSPLSGLSKQYSSQSADYRRQRRLFSKVAARAERVHAGKQKAEDSRDGAAHSSRTKAHETSQSSSEHPHLIERLHLDRLHMPQFHRPTKEELLATATGFWSRLRIRFKWLTIRSLRPYSVDEITGFLTWIIAGHVLWIVIGTTTFFSLAIFAINTVFAQETLAGWVGNYLTKSSGIKVVFESAIVPKWGDGVITLKNVFVSRRPSNLTSGVSKGSPKVAAAAVAATLDVEEDTNYTQFDININEVNVTLSFSKWFNSKGLLQSVEVKGVRGVVDRTSVHWTGALLDPKSFRHEHNPGDFEIDSFKIEDLLVTIHQPKGFRPFPVSIYNADLPRLRKQYLFYDFLSANNITGEYDGSLFTIHPRQTNAFTGAELNQTSEDERDTPWKKQSRIRLDGLRIDQLNRGFEGPFSWINEGNVDIVADVMFPADNDESVLKVVSGFYERLEEILKSHKRQDLDTDVASRSTATTGVEDDKRFLVMDLRVHLNDVRAVVPLFTRDLSYVNNALIRPIVAYINSRRTFIPINCRLVKRVGDFYGSWTVFDSGLLDDLSAEVYDAFVRDIADDQARKRRIKKVGLWSLQLAVQAIFMGLATNIA